MSLVAFENRSRPSFDISRHSRFLHLRRIMENCNCIEIDTVFLDLPFYKVLRDPEARWNPLRILPNFVRNFDENAFQYIAMESISNIRNLSGYYQNFKLLKPVEYTLAMELQKFLDTPIPNEVSPPNAIPNIIHIRRGNYALPSQFSTLGVLSSTYYLRATSALNIYPWVAVTDDPLNMLDVTTQIQIEKILGPSDLNTIGALRAMANSRTLVISNSTLAWWGGFLAAHKGGRVVAPSSWHRKSGAPSLDVLTHDKFETVQADFFQNIHDYEMSRNLEIPQEK